MQIVKKKEIYEAVLYGDNNMEEVANFIEAVEGYEAVTDFNETWLGYFKSSTPSRLVKLAHGDWLVNVDGELAPYTPEQYEKYWQVVVTDESYTQTPSMSSEPRVIDDILGFPRHDHTTKWRDDNGNIWYWDEYYRPMNPDFKWTCNDGLHYYSPNNYPLTEVIGN